MAATNRSARGAGIALLLAAACAVPIERRACSEEGAPAGAADAMARLEKLLSGHTSRGEEGEILGILGTASGPALDHIFTHLDLARLVAELESRSLGPDRRGALYDLVARDRLADLGIEARTAFITALQRGATMDDDEEAIADILCGTRGARLTALKNAIDGGNDDDDLLELLGSDIDDEARRTRILDHFAAEAKAAPAGELKVLSDVDDTLYANWVDARYPKGTVYPGVLALYAELDRGAAPAPGRAGDLTFITARPGLLESSTHATLRRLGIAEAVVLTGSLTSIASNEAIAAKKFENFERYRALFPEYRFVFLGDSGQGDALFGRRMRQACPRLVPAIFIHDVRGAGEKERGLFRADGVYFCDTYVGAATEACRLGLVEPAGLARVARAARRDLAAIAFADAAKGDARAAELERDIAAANALLPEALRVLPPGAEKQ